MANANQAVLPIIESIMIKTIRNWLVNWVKESLVLDRILIFAGPYFKILEIPTEADNTDVHNVKKNKGEVVSNSSLSLLIMASRNVNKTWGTDSKKGSENST